MHTTMNKVTLALVGTALTLATAPILSSCSDDEDDPTALSFASGTGNIKIYHEGTKQIELSNATSPEFTTNDSFVCSVDDNGLVTGNYVGKTQVTVTDGTTTIDADVEVEARYELPYEEYFRKSIPWGSSLSKAVSVLGTDYTTDDSKYYFWNKDDDGCQICMAVTDGKIEGMSFAIMSSCIDDGTEFADALLERYKPTYSLSSSKKYYFSYTGNEMDEMAVLLGLGSSKYAIVAYTVASKNKSLSLNDENATDLLLSNIEKNIDLE